MELATIRVRADPSMIPVTLAFVEDLAKERGMAGDDLLRLRLETEEIMDTIINYGFAGSDNGYFDVSSVVEGDLFSVVIRDKGKPYDYDLLERGDATLNTGARILKGMSDGPKLSNMGRMGREQTVMKRLPVPVDAACATGGGKAYDGEPVFDIHPLREEESIEVSQCLYDEFGYSYPYEAIYYPEKFFTACKEGRYLSQVAADQHGEIAAHLALVFSDHFPGTAEIAMGVTKHKFRKYSLMSRLSAYLTDRAEEMGLDSIFAQPVAYHPYTQKICNKEGMFPCAVMLNYINHDLSSSFDDGGYRRSVFTATRMFSDSHRDIHIPEEIHPLAGFIIEGCGLDRALLPGNAPLRPDTVCEYEINPILLTGKLYIDSVGADVPEVLARTHRLFREKLCELCDVYINACDPAAPYAYEAAKTHGYFCTGLFPSSGRCDFIVMQCVIYATVNYDSMSTVEPFSQLIEMVRRLDPNGGE